MTASRTAQAAALGAVALGLLLALLDRGGPPRSLSAGTAPAAPGWAEDVERGADHVTGAELVALLERDRAEVLLVDLRPPEEAATFSLRGAVNLSVPRLLGPEGTALLDAHPTATVVLHSNGMTHPAQAWVALAAQGRTNVRVLEDGLEGLKAGLLTPPSLRGPTTERAARAAYDDYARAHAVLLGRRVPPLPPMAARLATDPARLEEPTIVSTAWVAGRGPDVVLLDAREKAEAYAAGHLPGARHLPIAATRETRDGTPEEAMGPEALARVFGQLGIDADTPVVAYGEEKLQDPTHVALLLVSLGHRRVAVMEGGLGAWRAEGRPVVTEAPSPPTARTYAPRGGMDGFWVRIDDVAEASRSGAPLILDVRPGDAFRGEVSTEARPGHIPGSVNREFKADTAPLDGGLYWRPLPDLRAEYASLGVTPDRPVIVTCRTGHQASQTWFTLKFLLRHPDVRWYDGSWKEWAARKDLPAATGPSRRASTP